jgi:hypothetical protein
MQPNAKRLLLVLLLLAGLAVAVRLVGLAQYPQVHPDEGFWACGSRNLVLHGDGLMDGRLHPFLSQPTFLLLAGVFSVAEPDLVTARATSVVLGLLTVGLFAAFTWRRFTDRPWLVVLLFGLSGLAVLIQRMVLLEAHQMLWLVVATGCWLSSGRLAPVAAGLAFAMAMLVKSNSIYLLPAFLLTLPASGRWRWAGLFLASCLVLAGGGYLLAWGLWPEQFVHAFQYEVAGARFADEDTLFRIGRFGLHPPRAGKALWQMFFTDGLLVLGGLAGLVMVILRWRSAQRRDRFFALWLVLGLTFLLGQIYVEHRYLTTLAPALVYLAALVVEALLDRPRIVARILAVVLLAAFSLATLGRVGAGAISRPSAEYWQVVGWMRREARPEARVLADSVTNLSLPQRGYDFFRALVPYDGGPPRRVEEVVEQHGISYLIVGPEWRPYENADLTDFIARRCVPRQTIGETTIYEVVSDTAK